ncbi:hypothetical protein [[Clostridium] dakarense]|uniref:hypothetical protein n=1 Tax=Faecalimicrobium dakarense TaxID=1301100 RepID=UPI0004B12FC4|nr:hypothetical protein [[Clostridium] dakarense]
MKGKIIILSGPAGVGKSTTADILASNFNKSAYISGDIISHMPVSGYEKPWESQRAKDLVLENIIDLSKNFLSQGYNVISDWVIFWDDAKKISKPILDLGYEVHYAVLWSDEVTNLKRDKLREVDCQMGERVKVLRSEFKTSNIPNQYFLDNTNLDLDQVVSTILSN